MRLVLLAAGWTAGIYLATLVDIPPIGIFAVLAEALLIALLLRLRARPVLPAVVMALIALGALRASVGMGDGIAPPIQSYNGQDSVAVQGVVVSDPDRRSSGWHFRLAVERVLLGDDWQESQGGLLVTARPPAAMIETGRDPLLRYGDRLVVTGEVEQPEAFQDFDYRDYLARQGIHSVMLYPRLALAGEGEGNPQLGGVYRLRYRLSQSLSQSLSEPQGAMGQAILLGIRSAIPSDLVRAFRETGTSHLLAISGLHVGVFLALSLAASRLVFGARGRVYVLAPLAAVWMYAALSGMSPSVQRAAIMGSVYLAGLYLGRQNSGMPALAAAAAVMVGLSPAILTSVSFQLSFAAMAGLVLLSPPIERRLQLALPAGPERPWSRELTFAIAASVAATLATLPLVAYYFNYVSLVSLPATLLAMPAMPFILGSALLTSALGLLDASAARPAAWIAWLCLSYLKQVVELFDAIPGSAVRVGWMGAPLVAAYYAALAGVMMLRPMSGMLRSAPSRSELPAMPGAAAGDRGRLGGLGLWSIVAVTLLATAATWSAALERPDGRLHVTYLDVGQGDSIFIVTPGGRQVLVDGGPDPKLLLNLLGERMPFWDRSLDLVVLTHPHSDHAAGVAEALRSYDVALVLEREVDHGASEYASWRAALRARAGPVVQALPGQRIQLDHGLVLEVLYPPERVLVGTSSDLNNSSVVTRLVYGETSFLLTGDIHWDAENYLLRRSLHLDSTVLKVGHQGSRTSTTPEFLEEVSPQVAIISVGADNRFGHPHPEVVKALTEALGNDRVFATYEHGSVEIVSDGASLSVQTER